MINDTEEINVVIQDTDSVTVTEGTPTDIAEIMHNEEIRIENENQRIANEEQRIENETAREDYITDLKQRVLDGEFNGEDGYSPAATVSKTDSTATITITDKNGTTTAQISDGQDGQDGQDGFSPIANVTKSGDTATITITDKTGTTTATVSDGTDGVDGTDGEDGYSPTATVSKSGKIATITITDKDGTTTAEIRDGEDGQGSGDMLKSTYDTDNNGIVDNAEKVNNHTVLADVPADASFTDFAPYYTYMRKGSMINPVALDELDEGTYFINAIETPCCFVLTASYSRSGIYTGSNFILTIPKKIELADLTDGDVVGIVKTFLDNSYVCETYIYLKYKEEDSGTRLTFTTSSITIDNAVDKANAQTISGKKTFSTLPESSVTPTTNNQLVNKSYVDTAIDNKSNYIPEYIFVNGRSTSPTLDPLVLDELEAGTYLIDLTYTQNLDFCYFKLSAEIQDSFSQSTGREFVLIIPKKIDVSTLSNNDTIAIIKNYYDSVGENVAEIYTYLYYDNTQSSKIDSVRKLVYIKNAVDISHTQTITGKKTFSTLPESSVAPTTNDQLTNKSYVDTGLSGKQATIDSSHKLSADLVNDSNTTHKFVTASDKTTWSGKQDALVSGTNIKTINNTSILGSGDIEVGADIPQQDTAPSSPSTGDLWLDTDENATPCYDNYSTNETQIGYWIDGKPLYRKVVPYTATSVIGASGSQTDINIAHNISNIKTCVKSSGILYYPGNEGIVKPLPQISGSTTVNSSTIIREVNSTNIILRITNDTWSSPIIHFILEYTKTTD